MSDNLQQIVDDLRAQLAEGIGVLTSITVDGVPSPLDLQIVPDGLTWLCYVKCGQRVLFDEVVEPEAFVASLYTWLRLLILEVQGRGPKRARAN